MTEHFVIVGGGLAGASAASELRENGFGGRVRLISGEPHPPYIRPPLSKGYLAGTEGLDAVWVHPREWYDEHRVDLDLGRTATGLDTDAREVTLDGGETVAYDKLLLATGSTPRKLPIPGADLDGVVSLRTLDDSDRLREELSPGGKRLVLIGSGWIGMEVGATARTLGNEVVILERDPIPLANAIGDELGEIFAQLHREHGVDLRTSVNVESIVGDAGRATGVRLATGEIFDADLVLVGVGVVPNTALAEAAGLEVENGILVDESLRTSETDIFAAGDVANAFHPLIGQRLRSEHWANALNEGPAAARAMLGLDVRFEDIPYFYTDQFDVGMEYSGYGPLMRDAQLVCRGDLPGREFIAFWLQDGRVVAGMNVNVWDVNEQVQRLIREGERVDAERLADASVPLEQVAVERV